MTRKSYDRYESVYKHFPSRNLIPDLQKYVDHLWPRRGFQIAILPKGLTMARNNAFTKITFCNIKLTDIAKKDYKKWSEASTEDLPDLLQTMINAEIKVTLSADGERDVYLASMTCKNQQSANSDCCVTSRADSLEKAISIMLYKFFVLLSDVTWSDFALEDDWG